MALNLNGYSADVVADKWGSVRLTTSSNVAVATAIDTNVREIYIQGALANASAVRIRIGAVCSAATGIELPRAVGSAGGSECLCLPVAALSLVNVYANESGDIADLIWHG